MTATSSELLHPSCVLPKAQLRSPIAIACLRLFTAPPLPPFPERRVPFFSRRTALSTALPAALPYLRPLDFLREPAFFLAAISSSQKHVAPSDPLSTAGNYDAATTVCVVGQVRGCNPSNARNIQSKGASATVFRVGIMSSTNSHKFARFSFHVRVICPSAAFSRWPRTCFPHPRIARHVKWASADGG
jgi:hypothetical protein